MRFFGLLPIWSKLFHFNALNLFDERKFINSSKDLIALNKNILILELLNIPKTSM